MRSRSDSNHTSSTGMDTSITNFKESEIHPNAPDRCVDGRCDPDSQQGPQLLGGDIHAVTIKALFYNSPISGATIKNDLTALKNHGVTLGLHRGSHRHPEENICDCGFCDRQKDIILTAKLHKKEILDILKKIFITHQDVLPNFSVIENAYSKIDEFLLDNILLTGEDMISVGEKINARTENLTDNHKERQAFVNLKPGITLDTKAMNAENDQAFNLDIFVAIDRCSKLGIDKNFALAASLILYIATEMVLVEQKGKQRLPIIIHS